MNDGSFVAPADALPSGAAPAVPALSILLVQLLKGVLYRDDDEAQ